MNFQTFKIMAAKWASEKIIPALAPEGPLRWVFAFAGMNKVMPLIDQYASFIPSAADGSVDMEMFRYAVANSRNPLCYNGDLTSLQQIETFRQEFPGIEAVMIGRGLIADPGILSPGTVAILEAFHNELLERYLEAFGGSRNAMFRLKENWRHLLCKFEGSEKLGKRLRKTTDAGEYKAITREIFRTLPLREEMEPDW